MDSDSSAPVENARDTRRSNRAMLIGLAIAAVLVVLGLRYAARPEPVPLQGVVDAEEVSVASKAFARVVSLAVDEGDQVREGQILGQLSSPARDLLVSQGEASVTAAEALSAIAQQGARPEDIAALREISIAADAAANLGAVTAGRMNRLYNEGVVSAQRRDEANAAQTVSAANAAAARAQYQRALAGRREETRTIAAAREEAAKNRLEAAREAAKEEQLVAPMEGQIARRLAAPGEIVGPAIPIFRIIDTAHPYVTLRVGEKRFDGLAKGTRLSGIVPALGRRALRFEVTSISPGAGFTSDQATRQGDDFDARSFSLRLEPVDGNNGLLPGMSVLFDWPQ